MILARHAEALFWAGRQLERCESTVRALDVTSHNLMHVPAERSEIEWSNVLDALGLHSEFPAQSPAGSMDDVVDFLFADVDNPGSVLSSVSRLRENIRTVRDRVPVELWDEANRLHLELQALDVAEVLQGEAFDVYGLVRRRCQAISGVVYEAMPRDDGHTFLVVGRMIERALTSCRFARVFCSDNTAVVDASTLLRSVSALQAYRRQEGYDDDPRRLTLFLLTAEDVPRSVLPCLRQAEAGLESLLSEAPLLIEPRRRCGNLRSTLEFGPIEDQIATDSYGLLSNVELMLTQLADDLSARAFQPTLTPVLHSQFIRPEANAR